MQEQENTFSADDLALVSSGAGDDSSEESTNNGDASATAAAEQTEQKPAGQKHIVAGGDAKAAPEEKPEAKKSYWPDDWREKAAEHIAAGDKKVYERELRRLQRITDPSGLYGMYREAEGKLTSGGLLKVPAKDAKPEEIAEFRKALGVPEKPEDYFKEINLENGAVIGEADKPLVDGFAKAVHEAGATPAVMSAALNWYYTLQEQRAAEVDEEDEKFHQEAQRALKEEFGPAYKRNTNSIASLFSSAPGGSDINNENSLFSRLVAGRMSDGRIIGNDPDMVRFLVSLSREINPAATVVEDGNQSGLTLDAEIEKIEGIMRKDRREYDRKYAGRYQELIEARERIRERQSR